MSKKSCKKVQRLLAPPPPPNRGGELEGGWYSKAKKEKERGGEKKGGKGKGGLLTSSIEFLTIYRTIVTLFSCPRRSTRPMAWDSVDGFHCGSRMWTRLATERSFRLGTEVGGGREFSQSGQSFYPQQRHVGMWEAERGKKKGGGRGRAGG